MIYSKLKKESSFGYEGFALSVPRNGDGWPLLVDRKKLTQAAEFASHFLK